MDKREMKKELWIEISEEVGTMEYSLEERIRYLMPGQKFTDSSERRFRSVLKEIITEMRLKGAR